MTTESRLAQVENELAEVMARLHRLEGEMEYPEPQLPPDWGPAPAPRQISSEMNIEKLAWPERPTRPAPEPSTLRTAVDFEAVFGGRVLAWIGGVAILFAAVLFLGMAISRG